MAAEPFSETYAEARGKFRRAAQAAVESVGGSLSSRVLEGVVGSEGEELALDFALIGGPEPCSSLYLLTAGQHGVEGYLGSAIQIDTLKWLADTGKGALPEGCWIVMVHVMNPYGMSWWRRWNEENCDLNRNFLPDFEKRNAGGANDMYKRLDPLLNPVQPIGCCDCFLLKAAKAICCFGKPAIKQAVAGGQPEFETGLFYSGRHAMQSHRHVVAWLREHGICKESPTLKFVIHNDLHTGLGPHGHDSVLTVDETMKAKVVRVLGGERGGVEVGVGQCACLGSGSRVGAWHVENMGADGKGQVDGRANGTAYEASGNIMDGLRHMLCPTEGCDWTTLSQEFGTVGNVAVLKTLRAENALNRVQPDAPPSTTAERIATKNVFYPTSPAWREGCLERGRTVSRELIEAVKCTGVFCPVAH